MPLSSERVNDFFHRPLRHRASFDSAITLEVTYAELGGQARWRGEFVAPGEGLLGVQGVQGWRGERNAEGELEIIDGPGRRAWSGNGPAEGGACLPRHGTRASLNARVAGDDTASATEGEAPA